MPNLNSVPHIMSHYINPRILWLSKRYWVLLSFRLYQGWYTSRSFGDMKSVDNIWGSWVDIPQSHIRLKKAFLLSHAGYKINRSPSLVPVWMSWSVPLGLLARLAVCFALIPAFSPHLTSLPPCLKLFSSWIWVANVEKVRGTRTFPHSLEPIVLLPPWRYFWAPASVSLKLYVFEVISDSIHGHFQLLTLLCPLTQGCGAQTSPCPVTVGSFFVHLPLSLLPHTLLCPSLWHFLNKWDDPRCLMQDTTQGTSWFPVQQHWQGIVTEPIPLRAAPVLFKHCWVPKQPLEMGIAQLILQIRKLQLGSSIWLARGKATSFCGGSGGGGCQNYSACTPLCIDAESIQLTTLSIASWCEEELHGWTD